MPKMSWTDWRGKQVHREVKTILDANDFRGTPIYPYLIIAANPHLSVMDIWHWLSLEAESGLAGVLRPRSWIQRKRWMVQLPGTTNASGAKPNGDGNDERAKSLMRANPTASARDLVRLLKEHGIARGKDWVWRHRCD